MTKYQLKLTQRQLDTVGDKIAANGGDCRVAFTYGNGFYIWPDGEKQVSYYICGDSEEVLLPGLKGANDKICLFTTKSLQLDATESCVWVVINDGRIDAYRAVSGDWVPFDSVTIVGHSVHIIERETTGDNAQKGISNGQMFGRGTVSSLSKMTIGVAGASGTGSIVCELLYRLGVGRLVVVDNDVIEERNLNRILNSKASDASNHVKKVDMLSEAFRLIGLNTKVVPIDSLILSRKAVKALSQCDFIFGCLDSVDGRSQLNRISTYYCIPYIDLGVGLRANKQGGIASIGGEVRYVIPGESSLLTRGTYTQADITAASISRSNPDNLKQLIADKYIKDANEESPAVISVNMTVASMGVNDMLARIHDYRHTSGGEENSTIEGIDISISGPYMCSKPPTGRDDSLIPQLGKGDCDPLLGIFSLGEVK